MRIRKESLCNFEMAAYFEKLHKVTIGSPDETNTFDFMKVSIKRAISELWGLEGRTSNPYVVGHKRNQAFCKMPRLFTKSLGNSGIFPIA